MRGPDEAPGETVSFGQDGSSVSVRARLAAVAGVCLVGGFLAGDRANVFGDDAEAAAAPAASSIALGSIDKSHDASDTSTGSDFELPVRNGGDEQIRVTDVDLVGLGTQVNTTLAPVILPGEWDVVELQVPADCSTSPPADVSAVRLSVEGSSGTDDVEVPLPYDGAAVWLDYHRTVCARLAPVDADALAGVWALQTAFGPETGLEGALLMRFTADGTYVWDFEGSLFSGGPDVWGSYRIRGRQLVFTPEGGFCRPSDISTWRTSVDDQQGVLTMVGQPGSRCPDGEGVWIARRVLHDHGLPPTPQG